ncbi:hypothetical protein [Nonomuraea jabiensis]|uniref:hypothetical protein n=1 Tax=Nonomuraea jabiensis TaxID=882448 RepID=UPI003D7512BD
MSSSKWVSGSERFGTEPGVYAIPAGQQAATLALQNVDKSYKVVDTKKEGIEEDED